MRRIVVVAAAAFVAAAAACDRAVEPVDGGSPEPTAAASPSTVRCPLEVPAVFVEWEAAEEIEVEAEDHIGVRETFTSEGRSVTLMVGIAGEVGEGLPVAGQRETTTGMFATLQGEADTWALTWRDAGTCGDRAVLGEGLGQADFEDLMREARILRS